MGSTVSPKILVVDDEKHIVELARLYLAREGYEVEGVGDGAQAVARFTQVKPDLVILDIMLPGTDGLTICKEIRKQSQVPIIMLTARDEVTDKVVGLEVGADDYLTKPFHPQELVARAKALLRRARTESDQPRLVRAGKLEVDIERHEVRFGDEKLQLRPKEFDLLALLARHPGASCSTWCGATTSLDTREPSTFTFSKYAKSWLRRRSLIRASRRCGASATGWS